VDLNLQIAPRPNDALIASYSCPCGCNPRVTYARGADALTDDCCCGNVFAVGPNASAALPNTADHREQVAFDAPWGGQLEAAWKLVVLAAEPTDDHDHDHGHGEHHGDAGTAPTSAIDPVCGMTVDTVAATTKDLTAEHGGVTYYFCGRGCKLEFGDDPGRYLDPSYVPSM
jgi:YHS domain-containing protein